MPAVISSERESRGITLLGVDPLQERSLEAVWKQCHRRGPRVLIRLRTMASSSGGNSADKLDTEIGKRIVLMSQDPGQRSGRPRISSRRIFRGQSCGTGRSLRLRWSGDSAEYAENRQPGQRSRTLQVMTIETSRVLLMDTRRVMDQRDLVQPWYELDTYLASMLDVMDGFVLCLDRRHISRAFLWSRQYARNGGV